MSCHQLIYASRPTVEVNEALINDILTKALSRNYALQISGLLVFYHGAFMQLIEGNKDALDELFGSIRQDKRHDDIRVLLETESRNRCMPTWAMGFTMGDEFSAGIKDRSFYISCDQARDFCKLMPESVGNLFIDFMREPPRD